jgi:cytochrome c553
MCIPFSAGDCSNTLPTLHWHAGIAAHHIESTVKDEIMRKNILRLRLRSAIVAGLALLATSTSPHASDVSKGLTKAAICASCHGPAGISPVPGYPNIAGQDPLYLEYALRRYRAGDRRGDNAGMMYTVSQALTDADIGDLAAYYGSLRPAR